MSYRRMIGAAGLAAGIALLGNAALAQTLEYTSGPMGGGWYTIVTGTAKIFEEKNKGLSVKVVPGAGAANPSKVQGAANQMALSIDIFVKMAAEGKGIYESKGKHDNLRMIGQSLGDTPYHLVRAKGQTLSFDDLFTTAKDMKFGVIKAGATDEIAFRWVMAEYGQTYDSLRARGWKIVNLDYSELAAAFKDGQIDYAWMALGLPAAAVMDMQTGREGEIVEFPQKVLDGIFNKYGMGSGKIPAGTYPKYQTKDVTTMVMKTTMIVHKDTPDDVVYNVAKTLCEAEPDLPKIHGSMRDFKCATAISAQPVPVHPGALKFYKEKGIAK